MIESLSRLIMVSLTFLPTLRIEERPSDVSSSNECSIVQIQCAIFSCLLIRHRHNFAYAIRTYQSCSTRIDFIIRRHNDVEPEDMRMFKNTVDYLGHEARFGHLEVSTRMIDALRRLKHSGKSTELQLS